MYTSIYIQVIIIVSAKTVWIWGWLDKEHRNKVCWDEAQYGQIQFHVTTSLGKECNGLCWMPVTRNWTTLSIIPKSLVSGFIQPVILISTQYLQKYFVNNCFYFLFFFVILCALELCIGFALRYAQIRVARLDQAYMESRTISIIQSIRSSTCR